VAPLTPRPGHGFLRCPVCRLDLTTAAGALVCRNRHGFDLAREGYVNLLRGGRRHPAAGGDGSAQLGHRRSFLDAGHFDAIASAIAGYLQHAGAKPAHGCWHVLDCGFGTGHHLARLEAALSQPSIGLGLDIARDAARQAARRWPALAFAVADLWAEWPVKDAAIDLVISIFAPRNFPEAARVLRRGGWLAVAYPGPEHLRELSHRFGLLTHHARKSERIIAETNRWIGPSTIVRHRREVTLDAVAARAAIMMGPNAHHIAPSMLAAEFGPMAVTFDIAILLARKRKKMP
jgi:23S rRNA (guanine745-N1)-methyltransferase